MHSSSSNLIVRSGRHTESTGETSDSPIVSIVIFRVRHTKHDRRGDNSKFQTHHKSPAACRRGGRALGMNRPEVPCNSTELYQEVSIAYRAIAWLRFKSAVEKPQNLAPKSRTFCSPALTSRTGQETARQVAPFHAPKSVFRTDLVASQ